MDDLENCPICGNAFPLMELISHSSKCTGEAQPPSTNIVSSHNSRESMDVEEDEDFKLALKLQQEEEQERNPKRQNKTVLNDDEALARQLYEEERQQRNKESGQTKCQKCSTMVSMDNVYILDECTHRFCQDCLRSYVAEKIVSTVALECPIPDCKKALSVRDMKDLLPQIQKAQPSFMNPTKGSGKATERIMAEMKHIMKSDPEKNGYSVKPLNDNLYKWELKFFNFDKTEPLAQDMDNLKVKNILLHITFPPSYPFAPPYIRVIKPRFQYRTGHVTIGGSICMEVLTNKGWSPANTLEAIIVSIRAQLIAGAARLDPHTKHDYTEQEAKEAFDRMVQQHNWY